MTRFNKRFCEENRITFDYSNLMQGAVLEQGITDEELSFFEKKAKKAFKTVKENRGTKMMGWTELPYNQKEVVEEIIKTAKDIKKKFDYFVVLGIGGSALGPMAVFNALNHLHHNDLPKYKRKSPKFYVEDNVDPERMGALLDVIDLDKTMFNVITKSGATSETMAQFLIILDLLKKKFKDKANEHIIATTSETKGNLIKIAKEENIKTFYIPEGVGGRFSELCPVGLLPAAVLNVDIKELLADR
ncbi:MAG: glucose-6-phosphate isomerase, partial [Clostridiales bacterium]|nr:glucose-6-phosphate isomerase [Clostridiales bacterium]